MKNLRNLMFALVLLVCTSFGLVACLEVEKTAITTETFVTTMEGKGFTISDESERDLLFYDVDKVSIATRDDCIIEFYEFGSVEDALDLFEELEFDFKFESFSSKVTGSGMNYNRFEGSGAGGYALLCRVDSTLMIVDVESKHIDIAKSIVKEFGY